MIFLFWAVGIVFIALAIPLMRRKVPPNRIYGVRVAETLENETVWYEVNARGGRDLLWVGVLTMLVSSFLFTVPWKDDLHYLLVCGGLVFLMAIGNGIRSIRMAKRMKRELGAST